MILFEYPNIIFKYEDVKKEIEVAFYIGEILGILYRKNSEKIRLAYKENNAILSSMISGILAVGTNIVENIIEEEKDFECFVKEDGDILLVFYLLESELFNKIKEYSEDIKNYEIKLAFGKDIGKIIPK